MTLVVCPNLAVDRVLAVRALTPGGMQRARLVEQQAGGKGANVVRALRRLGGDGLLCGLAAGAGGRLIAELAAREGLPVELVGTGGEARVSTVVLSADEPATRIFELGPRIGGGEERALLAAVHAHPAAAGEWAVVDGAAPPGSTAGFYAALAEALGEEGYRVLVDATGRQLATALAGRPDLVKVNDGEAREGIAGLPRSAEAGPSPTGEQPETQEPAGGARAAGRVAEGLRLCRQLVAAGARGAVVTLGADGAVALLHGAAWRVPALTVPTVNTTGSGDCFAGALLLALERGEPAEAALAAAAGAAAANAADPVTGRFDPALARRLAAAAHPRRLALHAP